MPNGIETAVNVVSPGGSDRGDKPPTANEPTPFAAALIGHYAHVKTVSTIHRAPLPLHGSVLQVAENCGG